MKIDIRQYLVGWVVLSVVAWSVGDVWAQSVPEIEHIHVLLAMDTEARNVSSGVQADLQNLAEVLVGIRAKHEEKITIDILQGEELSPQSVIDYYRTRRVSPSEGHVFIYSGHGGLDPVAGHFLAMSGGKLYRSSLRVAMDRTNAGLTVILTNCCSNVAGMVPPNRRTKANWDAFQQLFFRHRGMVDVTAASEGTFGWISSRDGGFFTQNLVKLFCDPIETIDDSGDGFISWNEFAAHLREGTNKTFVESRDRTRPDPTDPEEITDFDSQLPQIYSTGFSRWEYGSLHAELRAETWREGGLRYALATYAKLDPSDRSLSARSKMKLAARLANDASACFRLAANFQKRALKYADAFGTASNRPEMVRRQSDLEQQADAYENIARKYSQ